MLGHVAHALLDHVQHLNGEGAHRALKHAVVRHHVGGFTGVDHGHRNHTGVHRFLVACDDGLEGLHHLAGNGHRVDAVVGQRGVAALAPDGDVKLVARRHHRARAHRERAGRVTRPVVHAENGFHGKAVEEPVLDHLAGASAAFFGRLEDQVDRAIKGSLACQHLRGGEQHGGVPVVAAGMHLAGMLTGMGKGVEFGHGQRVHVGAQAHAPAAGAAIATMHHAHHAGHAQPTVYFNPPLGQLGGHDVGGSDLLVAQLGVGMQVAPDLGQALCLRKNGVVQLHGPVSSVWSSMVWEVYLAAMVTKKADRGGVIVHSSGRSLWACPTIWSCLKRPNTSWVPARTTVLTPARS